MIHQLKNGYQVSLIDDGPHDGEAVLYFHNTPGSCFERCHFGNELECRNVRFIAINRPGYGDSEEFPYDDKAIVKQHLEVLDTLGIHTVTVMGFSGGGRYAAHFAYYAPERTRQLILLSSISPLHDTLFAGLPSATRNLYNQAREAPMEMERNLAHINTGEALMALMEGATGIADQPVFRDQTFRQCYRRAMKDAIKQGIGPMIRELAHNTAPWSADLGALNMPVQIWQGSNDNSVSLEMARHLHQQIPNSRLILVQQTGHYLSYAYWNEILKAAKPSPAALNRGYG